MILIISNYRQINDITTSIIFTISKFKSLFVTLTCYEIDVLLHQFTAIIVFNL